MGVFGVTATSSLFAYIWLYYVLIDQVVEKWEAWVTFIFFFILVALAFAADRYKASKVKKDDVEEVDKPFT